MLHSGGRTCDYHATRTSTAGQRGLDNICNFFDISTCDTEALAEPSCVLEWHGWSGNGKRQPGAKQWKQAQEVQRKAAVVLKLVALLRKDGACSCCLRCR